MAEYTLNFFDLSNISTDDPDGFSDNGGYQMDLGVSTVTIAPGSTEQALTVTDWNDATFDDDGGGSQILTNPYTINGIPYPAGTNLESEYELTVQDSLGTNYILQFVSFDYDAYNIQGFVIQGTPPPFGEALTVVGRADMTQGVYSYAASSPACFGPDAMIDTVRGPVRAGALRAGAMLRLADGGAVRLRLVLHSRTPLSGGALDAPVRLRAGALGPGLPLRDLLLSPQHRVLPPGGDGLVAARALTALPRIGPVKGLACVDYVHLVTARHVLLRAEGVVCESFWPGAVAMRGLPAPVAAKVRRIMGPSPAPARRFLPTAQARRKLALEIPVAGGGNSG